MPVDTKHPQYIEWAPAWKLMRDTAGGQRKVHAAGEAYLPMLSGEKPEAYKARQARTAWYNATWRTIEGLLGFLFRKEPDVVVSTAAEPHLKDVTKSGQPLAIFAAKAAEELETVGRLGVLTDYPPTPTDGLTVKQAEAMNVRPHLALYVTESIINWDYAWINNRTMLSLVVLTEKAPAKGNDRYERKTVDQWRELALVPHDGGHAYQVTVWQKDEKGEFTTVGAPFFPLMGGKPLAEIPFEIFGDGLPPLEDLANVNVSHYQTTADLEHGAHKTALPQPWVAGVTQTLDPENGRPVDSTLTIGGGDAWAFPDPNTQVGMLEYTGQGLAALETRLDVKERQMAVLGARMLEQQKRAVESAEAAGIHRAGEQSTLQAQADLLSLGFERVLGWFDKWSGGDGADVKCAINKDFFPAALGAQEITAIVGAWQQGAISKEQLFQKFQKGGVVSDGADFEDEETKIAQAPPTLLAAASGDDEVVP